MITFFCRGWIPFLILFYIRQSPGISFADPFTPHCAAHAQMLRMFFPPDSYVSARE